MDIMITQATVIVIVMAFFSLGILVRPALGGDMPGMSRKQLVATILTGFLLMALPLCKPVWHAYKETTDLIILLTALVPPFTAGLMARREIAKVLEAPSAA